MDVYDNELKYFSLVVDRLHKIYDLYNDFKLNNAICDNPMDRVASAAISEFKGWLITQDGCSWLGTLGYTLSGHISCFIDTCPTCGRPITIGDKNTCECCGKTICSPCSHIVENYYGVRWCACCVSGHRIN